jgi:hypothetical protein
VGICVEGGKSVTARKLAELFVCLLLMRVQTRSLVGMGETWRLRRVAATVCQPKAAVFYSKQQRLGPAQLSRTILVYPAPPSVGWSLGRSLARSLREERYRSGGRLACLPGGRVGAGTRSF